MYTHSLGGVIILPHLPVVSVNYAYISTDIYIYTYFLLLCVRTFVFHTFFALSRPEGPTCVYVDIIKKRKFVFGVGTPLIKPLQSGTASDLNVRPVVVDGKRPKQKRLPY